MRRIVQIFAAALALAACSAGTAAPPPLAWEKGTLTIETGTGLHVFTVEIADDEDERERGLMYRTQMAPDAGMIFEYPDPQQITIWMKNTVLSLDIIYIADGGIVRNIVPNAVPYSLEFRRSDGPVIAALELNAGTAAAIGLAPGDVVRAPFFRNQAP